MPFAPDVQPLAVVNIRLAAPPSECLFLRPGSPRANGAPRRAVERLMLRRTVNIRGISIGEIKREASLPIGGPEACLGPSDVGCQGEGYPCPAYQAYQRHGCARSPGPSPSVTFGPEPLWLFAHARACSRDVRASGVHLRERSARGLDGPMASDEPAQPIVGCS